MQEHLLTPLSITKHVTFEIMFCIQLVLIVLINGITLTMSELMFSSSGLMYQVWFFLFFFILIRNSMLLLVTKSYSFFISYGLPHSSGLVYYFTLTIKL